MKNNKGPKVWMSRVRESDRRQRDFVVFNNFFHSVKC